LKFKADGVAGTEMCASRVDSQLRRLSLDMDFSKMLGLEHIPWSFYLPLLPVAIALVGAAVSMAIMMNPFAAPELDVRRKVGVGVGGRWVPPLHQVRFLPRCRA
jgi:hypothetical protein